MEQAFDNTLQRIEYIVTNVPEAKYDDILFVLLYWQLFNNISLSAETIQAIQANGAKPETLLRQRRRVLNSD